ncbi:MAG: tetratricopeptide repeat protein [Bacteroidota bacterium]|nr:tetratricopeptide repeat protein [Bacteroidota bacterium]
MINAGFLACHLDENESAIMYVKQGLKYFESSGNKIMTAEALNIFGIISFIKWDSKDAVKYNEESLKILEDLNEKTLEANTKGNLAAFNTGTEKTEVSLKLLDDAIGIYRDNGQTDFMAKLLISKGGVYYQEGDYENAGICFAEGLPILIEVNDQSSVATTLYNLGNLNFALKKYSQSAEFYEESMLKSKEYGYTSIYDRAYIKLGEIALINNERLKAKEIFISCLKSFNKNSERLKLILRTYGLGNYYFLEKNYELSAKYFFFADRINEDMKFKISKSRNDENEKIILKLKNELQENKYNFLRNEINMLHIEYAAEVALGLNDV